MMPICTSNAGRVVLVALIAAAFMAAPLTLIAQDNQPAPAAQPAPAQPAPAQPAQPETQPAQPQTQPEAPPPALTMRYRFDADEAARDTFYDFAAHSASTTTIAGAGPHHTDLTLTTDVHASATLRVRCLGQAGGDFKLGFGITRLTFAMRDGDTSVDFAIGKGLGEDGKDGMTAHKDGEPSPITELDFWTGGAYSSTLPESMGQDVASATLSPLGVASRRAVVLPEPGAGADSKSIVTWLNPGNLAALLLERVPEADVTPNADRPEAPAWDSMIQRPALPGRAAGDCLVNCKLVGRVDGKPAIGRVTFATPVQSDVSVTGSYTFDVVSGRIESLQVNATLRHAADGTTISTRHSYRFARAAR